MNLLSFLIPTNNYLTLKNRFYTTLPVFKHFKEYITFCFNFQNYKQEEIDECVSYLENNGFSIKYTTNEYNWTPETFSFITMRNDAASVAPKDTLYFVDFDDDIYYYEESIETTTKLWTYTIDYLLKNPKVGSLRLDSQYTAEKLLQVPIKRNTIYPVLTHCVRTGLGLIYKNIYDGQVLPENCINLKGSHEDNLEVYQRCLDGYTTGFIINPAMGEHTDKNVVKSRVRYGLDVHEMEEGSVFHYIHGLFPYLFSIYPISPNEELWDEHLISLDLTANISDLLKIVDEDVKNYEAN